VTAGTLGAVIDAQKLMQARSEGRTVPITSYSVEEAVANGTFRFAPPLIDRSPRPKALYVVWRAFQFVFDEIDDPATFPPIQVPLPDDALDICRRYVAAAEDLAESELLCGDDEITIRWDRDDGESVESRFTSKEITRGFSVLLRQFDSNDERASFHNVYRALSTASAATTDSHAQRRARHLEGWLQARRLKAAAGLRLRNRERRHGRCGQRRVVLPPSGVGYRCLELHATRRQRPGRAVLTYTAPGVGGPATFGAHDETR
jgi:hypothetical protein